MKSSESAMARSGINKALVQQARSRLIARGVHPGIEMVRSELGNTGSKTTILRFLQELNLEEPKPPHVDVGQELQIFISSLAQRLAADAQDAVATDRARLDREQEAYQRKRHADVARLEELQNIYKRTDKERREGQERERELSERLQQLEGERQRLYSAEQHQLRLLEERAQQIASLEQKHREARARSTIIESSNSSRGIPKSPAMKRAFERYNMSFARYKASR
jgi:hypothetical protein